ncbi:hypothetical protein [Robertmurraya massiliosenegalensis]|uniref:hypothetical protein n=1 Tax=Robertmurraya massiliosenegalensis TaxID=1287657 RepID=UPI0011DDC3FD|nr:hypothetical protein [Robertmurraya massiliosenegalensis]
MKKWIKKRLAYLYSEILSAIIVLILVSCLLHGAFPNLELYWLPSFWALFILLEFLLILKI